MKGFGARVDPPTLNGEPPDPSAQNIGSRWAIFQDEAVKVVACRLLEIVRPFPIALPTNQVSDPRISERCGSNATAGVHRVVLRPPRVSQMFIQSVASKFPVSKDNAPDREVKQVFFRRWLTLVA